MKPGWMQALRPMVVGGGGVGIRIMEWGIWNNVKRSWEAGKLGSWEAGKLGSWEAGKLKVERSKDVGQRSDDRYWNSARPGTT